MTIVGRYAADGPDWVTPAGVRTGRGIPAFSYRATVGANVRASFGASYPITYVFSIPTGSSGLACKTRYATDQGWGTVPPLAAGANGVDGVRFDYPNSRAYLSAAFSHTHDDIYVTFVDGQGSVEFAFVEVADYYDDRVCPVLLSWDDWGNTNHAVFVQAATAHRDRGLWMSPGLNPQGWQDNLNNPLTSAQWADIQSFIDDGFLEPNNHGHTHKDPADGDYDPAIEIGAAVAAITTNLTLPPQSRVGSTQYVLGWIEPFGRTNAALQAVLASYTLINQRQANSPNNLAGFATFDVANNIFNRQPISIGLDKTVADNDTAAAEAGFDWAYNNRRIFHAYGHPWIEGNETWTDGSYDWSDPADPIFGYLDFLAGRNDVWYVAWGHLYLYRLTATEVQVTVDD